VSGEDFDDAITEEVSGPEAEGRGVTIDDFVAYMPMHTYIFTPCREFWVGASVNARLPRVPVLDRDGCPLRDAKGEVITMSATHWLDQNRPVEQMTGARACRCLFPIGSLWSEAGLSDQR
jgi:hypothetical protein